MNENLNIPEQLQVLLNEINNVPTYLAELPIVEDPKLPQFNRYIQVKGLRAIGDTQFIEFTYKQILKDKKTGEPMNMELPTPSWQVDANTWSYLRDEANNIVEAPTQDEEGLQGIKVPSYKYMIWLMKNNKAGLIELIQGYLTAFVEANIEKLNV